MGSGDITPDVKELNKVNGLADEYYQQYAQVASRWPWGLGAYLLKALAKSITKDGVLTVGKKGNSAGQYVYLNGHNLGLSTRCPSSQRLAADSPTTRTSWLSSPPSFPQRRLSIPTPWRCNLQSTRVIKRLTILCE